MRVQCFFSPFQILLVFFCRGVVNGVMREDSRGKKSGERGGYYYFLKVLWFLFFFQDDGEGIPIEERIKGYRYGKERIPINEFDEKTLKMETERSLKVNIFFFNLFFFYVSEKIVFAFSPRLLLSLSSASFLWGGGEGGQLLSSSMILFPVLFFHK